MRKRINLLFLFLVIVLSSFVNAGTERESQTSFTGGSPLGYNTGYSDLGFNFVASDDYEMDNVQVTLERVGSPSFDIIPQIWSVSAGNPDVLLAEGTSFNSATVPLGFNDYNLTFNNYTIVNGTEYIITINKSGGSFSTSDYVNIRYDNSRLENWYRYDLSSGWIIVDSTAEGTYIIYGNNVTPINITINDSVESTAVVKQVGTITTTGPTPVTVFSSDFNITVNNTDLYGAYSFNVFSAASNNLFCELEIDGSVVGNVTRTQVAGLTGSVYLQSEIFSLENGTHTQELICRRSSGTGQIIISNAVGIGHILIDENLNVVPHNETISSTTVTSGSIYSLLDEINFTISNRTIGGPDDVQHMLVLEWSGEYTNNNLGPSELLSTYININNSNCSFYPRSVGQLNTGVVSGDCLIKNATQNATYNIKIYGNGTNAVYDIDLKIKEFLLSPEEIEGGTGFPVPTSFSGDTDVLLFNFTGGNLNHGLTNVFQKNAFSIRSNETTDAVFYVQLVNGTNYTTVNFTRSISNNVGVLIGHDVLQNLPQDNYVSKLWANCGSATANCTIVGGDGIGYITDITSTISNSFNISLFDNYDNSPISGFSVTDGAIFNTTESWLLYFSISDFENLTISVNDGSYFPTTIFNHNTSLDLNVSLNQTIISWNCIETISGEDINCSKTFPFYPVEGEIFNYNIEGNPHTVTLSALISDNPRNYYDETVDFNVTALQNETFNVSFGYVNLLFNSVSPVGALTSCVYNVTSYDYNWTISEVGTPNSTGVKVINGDYNVVADCDGFALHNANFTINHTLTTLLAYTYNFTLYTTNSINFTFYDEEDLSLITSQVNIELISDSASYIYNTTTGSLYVDLLSPVDWTIRYSSAGYNERFYYFNLQNRTTTNISLYLLNGSVNITATVTDETSTLLEDAYLKILRYDVNSNSYILREIVKTNFEGEAVFSAVLNTEFYKILVEYPFGTVVKETSPAYLTSTNINIQVQLGSPVGETFFNSRDISSSLIFNEATNNFRFTYSDSNGLVSSSCVKVYKVTFFASTLHNTSCGSGSAGTILVGVENITGTTYEAKSYVYYGSEEYYVNSLTYVFDDTIEDGKDYRLFLIAILTLAFVFAGAAMGSVLAMILLAPMPIFLASLIGFINISKAFTIPLMIVALIITIILARKS